MTVRSRLVLTIVGISILMAVPAIYGASQLGRLRRIAQEQRLQHGNARVALGRLQTELAALDRYARSFIIDTTYEQRNGIYRSLDRARQQLVFLEFRGYSKEVADVTKRLNAIQVSLTNVVTFIQSNQPERATDYFEEVKPLLTAAQSAMEVFAAAIDERSRDADQVAENITNAGFASTLIALLFAVVAVLAIGYWTTTAIITPVRRLRRAMAAVAAGEYVVPADLPYQRQDEIGDLARSFSWMTEHLARLDKMKAEFISIATHELKTPINVIGGYAELVEEGLYGQVSSEQRNALQAIREQTLVLTRLVNQLLDISRLEAGGLQLQMGEVPVEELLESLQRSFAILAHQKDITLQFVVENSIPATIQGDSDRLRDQVLGNLLTNAVKFTAENGRVNVRAWGADRALELEVTDSGVGIPKDQIPYIFDKFYQIGQQARSKGAGLGLAIAREVVDAHGGRIWVDSTQGVGTTFRISLPVRQSGRAPAPEEPVEVGAGGRSS